MEVYYDIYQRVEQQPLTLNFVQGGFQSEAEAEDWIQRASMGAILVIVKTHYWNVR